MNGAIGALLDTVEWLSSTVVLFRNTAELATPTASTWISTNGGAVPQHRRACDTDYVHVDPQE